MVEEQINKGIMFARNNSTDQLEKWLTDGNDPNQHDEDGWTPLLWAAARGHYNIVDMLIKNGANSSMSHRESKALPIHLAGHSGNVKTAEILLDHNAEDLDAVWDLNGHTILLQAAFYGHLDLAGFLLKQGANTAITTARGLGPMEIAMQFQNHEMMEIIRPYDSSTEEKATYYKTYLDRIAPNISEDEKEQQELSDQLIEIIEKGLQEARENPEVASVTMNKIKELIEVKKVDVNRLGGKLQQPPLVVTVTGNNGFPTNQNVADLRNEVAKYLLMNGADPTKHEQHPMGAQTIIRAAVFNHLEILKMCSEYMTLEALTNAINEIPIVNGLTALHDTVLRATMAEKDKFEGYLIQCKWFMDHGGRSDIEDFAGATQKNYAERCNKPEVRRRLLEIL